VVKLLCIELKSKKKKEKLHACLDPAFILWFISWKTHVPLCSLNMSS
jgi:hypothetical protein